MDSIEQEQARRKIYQAMIEQAMQSSDPYTVVSGRVVPNPMAGVSKMVKAYMGRKGLNESEAREKASGEASDAAFRDAASGTVPFKADTFDETDVLPEGLRTTGLSQEDAFTNLASNPNYRGREALQKALLEKQLGISNASSYTRSQYENRNGVTGLATYDGRTGHEISFEPGRIPVSQDPVNRGAIKAAEGEAAINPAISKAGGIRQIEANVDLATKPEIERATSRAGVEGKAAGEASVALPATESSSEVTLDLVDQLVAHPGMKDVVGLPDNPLALKGLMPGSAGADFKARLDQITGRTFMEIFPTLKGGGQITEIEGQKGQESINRMKSATSEKEFKLAAQDFKNEVMRLRDVVRKRAGAGSPVNTEKKRLKYNRETGAFE